MIGTTFDTATTSLAGECITWAETEINKYLSPRYDLSSAPFQTYTSTPPIVQTMAKWLSQGYMYEQMARGVDSHPRAERLIKRATDNLLMISQYKMHLLDSAGSVIPEAANSSFRVLSNTDEYSNTFNEDDELNWSVDSDKLDDISSERD